MTESAHEKRVSPIEAWVHRHRAAWSQQRLEPWVQPGDSILDLGAGDCRLDRLLMQKLDCQVTPLDVEDFNATDLPLQLYDGVNIPFADNEFDVVLLIFALHHAERPDAVLKEAMRVCRRHVIAFEDWIVTAPDRWLFRAFHVFLKWAQHIPRPHHELTPDQWSELAAGLGLREHWRGPIGRQLGYFASKNLAFVWEKPHEQGG